MNAFPRTSNVSAEFNSEGMTLRDYFAAAVLPALLGNGISAPVKAYQFADEMLRVREL